MPKKLAEAEVTQRFRSLLSSYTDLRAKELGQVNQALAGVLPLFLTARDKWADLQAKTADEFNLFQVMGVEGAEIRHSMILAWFLDHRIEHGTHAQGNLGFRLFLAELARELSRDKTHRHLTSYAKEANYWVKCEVSGDDSRVDIEIAARHRFLIHIENKIWSGEGGDQTNREWKDLEARRLELGVPKAARHAIFLTLDGRAATNPNFCSVGWWRIAHVLERFATLAQPSDVKLFARHYAKALRTLSAVEREREELEVEDAQI